MTLEYILTKKPMKMKIGLWLVVLVCVVLLAGCGLHWNVGVGGAL